MLTIFTVPKPFDGHIGVIQRNAIRSWNAVQPKGQVLLIGDEAGTAEAAAELGAQHLPEVTRNELGTPLLDSVFATAESAAEHDLLCYTNADIMFSPDLVDTAERVSDTWRRFLVVGRAWNLDVEEELAFDNGLWDADLRSRIDQEGADREEWAIDYFAYPRGALGRLPPFAVGRPAWDNWMIYRARSLGVPVVDASSALLAVHQNHGYGHVREATGDKWQGPEAEQNRELLGGRERESFSLHDATHRLTRDALVPVRPALSRRLRTRVLLTPQLMPLYRLVRDTVRKVGR